MKLLSYLHSILLFFTSSFLWSQEEYTLVKEAPIPPIEDNVLILGHEVPQLDGKVYRPYEDVGMVKGIVTKIRELGNGKFGKLFQLDKTERGEKILALRLSDDDDDNRRFDGSPEPSLSKARCWMD